MGAPQELTVWSFLAPAFAPLYRTLADHIAGELDRPVRFVVPEGYDARACDEFADRGDIALLCGLPYVRLRRRRPSVGAIAAPVATGERYGGQPVYFSDVLTGERFAGASDLEDLAGAVWGYNEPGSHSGCGVVASALADRGLGWEHFSQVVALRSHEAVVEALLRGHVDAAAVDSHLLGVLRRSDPRIDESLRVVTSLGPSPIQPLVVSSRVPGELRAAIRDAVVSFTDRRALARYDVEQFVAIDDTGYDAIRRMEEMSGALLARL